MESTPNSQGGTNKDKPKITKDVLDKFFNSRNNLKDSIPLVKQAKETVKDIIEESKDIDLQEKLESKKENKKDGLKPKPEEDKPENTKKKTTKRIIKEPEPEIIEPSVPEEILAKEQNDKSAETATKIINIEQLSPQKLGDALESLKTAEEEPDIKAITEILERFTSYLHGLPQNLNLDDLRQELLRVSSVKNIIDQMMPFNWDGKSDVECNALYAQILDLDRAYHQFKYEYNNLSPSVDKSLEEIARNVYIETPKVGKKETEKKEKDNYKYEWEKQVDIWVEEKIWEEMRKRGIVEREIAEQNISKKLARILPHIFRDFAVHGVGEGGNHTDLDGMVCLGLMELVGWKVKEQGKGKNVSFIDHRERLDKTVHLDVGQYDGVAFLQKTDEGLQELSFSDKEGLKNREKNKPLTFFRNLSLIIDHHPEGAPSASSMLSRLLYRLRLFEGYSREDIKKIGNMVRFVDLIDSNGFQEIGKPENWNKSDRTVLGLYRFMSFPNLQKFFREDGNFYKPLTDEQLRRYGLIYKGKEGKSISYQERQRKTIDSSNQKLEELKKNQFIIDTKFGKIVIDINGKLIGGAAAAQSIGAGYLKWSAENKSFFMFSNQELDEKLLDKGISVRKRLWLLPKTKDSTGIDLNEIIKKIEGKIIPGSELEKYLNSEREK